MINLTQPGFWNTDIREGGNKSLMMVVIMMITAVVALFPMTSFVTISTSAPEYTPGCRKQSDG
jgi:hypothetical protein